MKIKKAYKSVRLFLFSLSMFFLYFDGMKWELEVDKKTVFSAVTFVFGACMMLATLKVLAPNLKKIPEIELQQKKTAIAVNLIVQEMGLQDRYRYLLAENETDTIIFPPTEIVEKQNLCKNTK